MTTAAIAFQTIWDNYPKSDPCVDPSTGETPQGFSNQCAVRHGTALSKSRVSFKSFHGGVCPVPHADHSMVAAAQQLADWLTKHPFPGCPVPETYTGTTIFPAIEDRTGIIFLANYWQRDNERGGKRRSGDHIDLWNGSRLTSLVSWIRVHWNFSIDGLYSDYRLASKALFWHIK